METRISLKLVKWIAVAGAILGLILLWIGVRVREIPLVKIAAVDLQTNMAIARIDGTVVDITRDPDKNTFKLTIDDGTGQASLNGFGKLEMFEKVLKDDFPMIGDQISAIGTISMSESWGVTMFLSSPRRLTLLSRNPANPMNLGEVTTDQTGHVGIFTGTIVDIRSFAKGRSLTVRDKTGEMSLSVFDSELDGCSEPILEALSKPGATIQFLGRIETYRHRPQLRLVQPTNPTYLKLLEPEAESGKPVSE